MYIIMVLIFYLSGKVQVTHLKGATTKQLTICSLHYIFIMFHLTGIV